MVAAMADRAGVFWNEGTVMWFELDLMPAEA